MSVKLKIKKYNRTLLFLSKYKNRHCKILCKEDYFSTVLYMLCITAVPKRDSYMVK